ncbi:MAG TPA: tripartite tricarboxylate transporter substrate binding protein [Xanthobacteraceae bacterium]|jgi:tripartite-type tricarboxylate transporter receptor subunit TctC
MKIVRVVLSFLLLATFAGVAGAEDWPTRKLRIVVPFPAGGSGDVQVRIVADELAKVLGQPVIVENKPGASGGLAAVEVARASPDGYTLMVGSVGTHAINVSLYSKLQYDPVKDFAPLTLMTVFPQLIVPGIDFKGDTLADLIASLKAHPGKASYGSSGIGSPTHLAGELFRTETGADIVHVPYRGQGPAANDLLGGQLQVMFPSVPDTLAFIVSGKLRALAIMGDRRLKLLPNVPTTVELGWPKLVSSFWAGLYATAGTPQPVLDRLNRELVQIVTSPGFAGRVEPLGFEARATTRDEFAQFNADEIKRWGQIVRGLGIQLNQ